MGAGRLLGSFNTLKAPQNKLTAGLILAAVVFFSCLFGIWTRPVGFLATVWPANALMLSLLIRIPVLAGPTGWIVGGIAFLAADLLTGASLFKALVLNGANLGGIAAAYLVYTRSPAARAGLRQPSSMLYLLLAAAAGGAVAGVVGGVANPVLFGGSIINGWIFWFATEFVNYVAILPVMLSAPNWIRLRSRLRALPSLRKIDLPPIAALLVSFAGATVIGGPGAIAFPVPALLWCALTYPVFPTAALTLLFGLWAMVLVAEGYVPVQIHNEMTLVSLRLGVSLIAVAPIMLACVMQSRNDLLARLQHLAMHDPLTGVFNRKAFRDEAQSRLSRAKQVCAVLMFDLDHFKAVNDTYGHASGDKVLMAFAERARACLRTPDLFGRLGGEEFCALIMDCPKEKAISIAERIRSATCEYVVLHDERTISVSTSIGIAVANPRDDSVFIDTMLRTADAMLYQAKEAGRNRIEASMMSPQHSPQ